MEKEYIERNALIAERTIFMQDEEGFDTSVVLVADIKLAPTAEVAEVVRCKNCVYFEESNNGCFMCVRADGLFIFPAENDFCSYGERK